MLVNRGCEGRGEEGQHARPRPHLAMLAVQLRIADHERDLAHLVGSSELHRGWASVRVTICAGQGGGTQVSFAPSRDPVRPCSRSEGPMEKETHLRKPGKA